MIVKKIISEVPLTLSEVKEILSEIKQRRLSEEGEEGTELPYEFRKALTHAETFARLKSDQAREMVERLLELDKMKLEIAIRIADLLPKSRDELRAVYAKERFSLTEEELDKILEIVAEYSL
jgi:DNA-directed RNA polymerase subunit F